MEILHQGIVMAMIDDNHGAVLVMVFIKDNATTEELNAIQRDKEALDAYCESGGCPISVSGFLVKKYGYILMRIDNAEAQELARTLSEESYTDDEKRFIDSLK